MHFLIVVSLFISLIFPILLSLVGLEWVSSDESPIYIVCVIGINGLVIAYIILYELTHYKNGVGSILPYFIPLIIAFIYYIECCFSDSVSSDFSTRSFIFFFAFSLVGIFSGTYCYRHHKLQIIIKDLKLLMFICSIALIAALPNIARSSSMTVTVGGGNHQAISYSSALAFGVMLYSFARLLKINRHKFFSKILYRGTAIFILILLPVVCFIGGGRGGVVLLLINFFICSVIVLKANIFKYLILILTLVFLFIILPYIPLGGLETHLNVGIERSFAFISNDGIDLANGSSGRDHVYETTLLLISQRPMFGYGLFGQYDICAKFIHQPYCHNLFLEVLLQFGIIGLIALLCVLFVFLKRLKVLISNGNYYLYLVPLATYPLIMLQFSGTYLFHASFWFIIITVFGYNKFPDKKVLVNHKKRKTNNKQND